MDVYSVFLVLLAVSECHCATADSDSNVIEYLRRIETRLDRLEMRLGSDTGTNKGGELNSNKIEPHYKDSSTESISLTVEMSNVTEMPSIKHERRRRAAHGAGKLDKKLIALRIRNRAVLRCLRGNFNRIVGELKQVSRKLSKTTQAVEDIENLILPIGENIQALDEELDDGLSAYVNKESLVDIKIAHGGIEIQYFCKKRTDLSKRERQKCEEMMINSDNIADTLQCCEHEKMFVPVHQIVPRDQTVVPGASVSLHCSAIGIPKPSMHWSLNSEKFFYPNQPSKDGRFTVYENGTLIIQNMVKSDEGLYTCRYGNSLGQTTAMATVTVIDPVVTRCEPVAIPLCKDMEYNFTSFPNLSVRSKRQDIVMEPTYDQFGVLTKVRGKFGYGRSVSLTRWSGEIYLHINDDSKCWVNGKSDKTLAKSLSMKWTDALALRQLLVDLDSYANHFESDQYLKPSLNETEPDGRINHKLVVNEEPTNTVSYHNKGNPGQEYGLRRIQTNYRHYSS